MGNEVQKRLVQRAKDLLQTEEDHSLIELMQLLRQFRNETHPDKFQDGDLQAKAETRFKEAQSLLVEMEKQLEVERFNRKPLELTIYKPLYDYAQLQSELDKANKSLAEAQNELLYEKGKTEELNKQLQEKKDDSLHNEIEHLQLIYTPSAHKYVSLGIAMILTGALGVMAQMEKISGILEKYSPFEKQFVSTGLFVCLLFFLVELLRRFWECEYIRRKSGEVCSPRSADDFIKYLKAARGSDAPIFEFSEVEVFDFIYGRWQLLKRVVTIFGFQIFRRETVNHLKDIFIHNVLNKKLVDFSRADNMQRFFTVSSSRANYIWYHEHMTRQEKEASPTAKTDE